MVLQGNEGLFCIFKFDTIMGWYLKLYLSMTDSTYQKYYKGLFYVHLSFYIKILNTKPTRNIEKLKWCFACTAGMKSQRRKIATHFGSAYTIKACPAHID